MNDFSGAYLEINDYEVFGIGAKRKSHCTKLHLQTRIRLIRHPLEFLPGLAEQTLAWLQPDETENRILRSTRDILAGRFQEIFPRGQSLLGDLQTKILDDYEKEMPWQEGLIDDHFRYFAFFLRTRFPDQKIWQEIFICEWARWSRTYQDLPWATKRDPQVYELNPSLQFYRLGEEAALALDSRSGLYAVFFDDEKESVEEVSLGRDQARILDLLEEDMGFSRTKVDAMAAQELGSAERSNVALQELLKLRILR